jgi:hypothetical protein
MAENGTALWPVRQMKSRPQFPTGGPDPKKVRAQKKGPLAGPHVQVEEFTPPSKGEKRRPAHASTQMKQPAYHK